MEKPKCLAIYKAGEYTGALWIANDIYVHGSFRAHGHGEFDLAARRTHETEWVDLEEGLNYNFGRTCDIFIQQITHKPETKETFRLLQDIGKAWHKHCIYSLGYSNFLMDSLFSLIEAQDMDDPDFFRVIDSTGHEDAVKDVEKDYQKLMEMCA